MSMGGHATPATLAAVGTDKVMKLEALAYALRRDVIEMVKLAGSGHVGGSLSSAEIVATLYWHVMRIDPSRPNWPDRDRLVLSKGHSAPIVYAALARRGYYEASVLETLRRIGSILQGHPDWRKTPGLDMTSGSLGQGLSVGLGMALAARQSRRDYQVYVLMSDGEMQEGMTWEAAMAASHYRASNLTVLIDRNNLQVDGFVNEVMEVEPLLDKWRAFGWWAVELDGHNVTELVKSLDECRARAGDLPRILICRTVKGKGVSFMENVMEWHSGVPTEEQYAEALMQIRPRAGIYDVDRWPGAYVETGNGP
jgi:transketolase